MSRTELFQKYDRFVGVKSLRNPLTKARVFCPSVLQLVAQNSLGPVCPVPLTVRGRVSPEITFEFQTLNDPERSGSLRPAQRKVLEYLQAVQAAGGFPAYARAHRSRYAPIFSRGTRLPADIIPKIVEYWAHLGWYKYE